MNRQVEVEAAKSSISRCKQCNKLIQKGQLRAKMVDDREFRQYLKKNPGARGCEGYSRGYFQGEDKVISIKKYFVHLGCYLPIYPHPIEPAYFRLLGGKPADKKKFEDWFNGQMSLDNQEEEEEAPARKKGKPASQSGVKKQQDLKKSVSKRRK